MNLSIERTHLDGLMTFLAVAELRGFRAASRRLGVTPSAVSQAIRVLEERIRALLFSRTTRSVGLTEAGERLLGLAVPVLDAPPSASVAFAPMVSSLFWKSPCRSTHETSYGFRSRRHPRQEQVARGNGHGGPPGQADGRDEGRRDFRRRLAPVREATAGQPAPERPVEAALASTHQRHQVPALPRAVDPTLC